MPALERLEVDRSLFAPHQVHLVRHVRIGDDEVTDLGLIGLVGVRWFAGARTRRSRCDRTGVECRPTNAVFSVWSASRVGHVRREVGRREIARRCAAAPRALRARARRASLALLAARQRVDHAVDQDGDHREDPDRDDDLDQGHAARARESSRPQCPPAGSRPPSGEAPGALEPPPVFGATPPPSPKAPASIMLARSPRARGW